MTPDLVGDRVACDRCGSTVSATLDVGDYERLVCDACLHADHEVISVSGRRPTLDGAPFVAYLICVDCSDVLRPLPVCGAPTLKGRPCRTLIRVDLGYRCCWSHGAGTGRTSTPRRRRAP
jgi:hypothetical protein